MYALTPHQLTGGEERERDMMLEPIECMCSPHTSYMWRGERRHRANQVYALATHQLQVERRERQRDNQGGLHSLHTSLQVERRESHIAIKCMLSPQTSYRWRVESAIVANQGMRSPHTSYGWRGERVIEPIKCMRSPHTSYRWRGGESYRANQVYKLNPHTSYRWRGERESHRDNQVYALTTPARVEMGRERHRANQVYALTTHPATGGEERSHRANQVYALATHQLQVERRES